MSISYVGEFGKTKEGICVDLYCLENTKGTKVSIITYGGAIQSIQLSDGMDVALGFSDVAGYERHSGYFGALVGRVAGRTANGRFQLNGKTYTLCCNTGEHHLHGGRVGFDKRVWDAEIIENDLLLSLFSEDGDENYPGNLHVKVAYSLSDEDELKIEYNAVCDQDTPINMTNHCYFDLSGQGNALDAELKVNADQFIPCNADLMPKVIQEVEGTPFDFREFKPIVRDIEMDCEQLKTANGYDHSFVIRNGSGLAYAATARDTKNGHSMDVYTTKPIIHLYTGNFLQGKDVGKGGKPYVFRSGFCLETQYLPNSINNPLMGDMVLKAGETYAHTTVYKFD